VTGVAFALFDWIDRRQGPLEQLYEERLHSWRRRSCFAWGDLTLVQSLRSLRLFAEQEMPAFQR
jgi:hypothetical protein